MNETLELKVDQILSEYAKGQDIFSTEIESFDQWNYSLDNLELKLVGSTSESL